MSIRWLHLSDFHTGKDEHGQRLVFKYILRAVQDKLAAGFVPDFVFLTGAIKAVVLGPAASGGD